jgi:hypothetical protein
MKLRTLQYRAKQSTVASIEWDWTGPAAAYYRAQVRKAYRYARSNGVEKHIARHLVMDTLLLGAEAKNYRYVMPVNS